jgi:hypothetical protein
MKYLCSVLFLSLLLSVPLAAEVTTNDSIPVVIGAFVPCANGGAGEPIMVSGQLHVLFSTTIDENGGVHLKTHFQPQGISGIGLVTGDKYQATGVTQEHLNLLGPLPITDTYVNNFRMIGQGPGNNLLVHQTFHLTVNANGTVTASVVNSSVECR